jgi:N6-adenosine-specific RNA methylase IME4
VTAALYQTVVADPPWPYRSDGGHLRSSLDHRPARDVTPMGESARVGGIGPSSRLRYGSMSVPEIGALQVERVVHQNTHLYLWTTNAFMEEAHSVVRQWGFKTKTILTWVKVKPDGTPSCKTGHYFRGATEHCLFCVRGSLGLRTNQALPTAYLWPRTPHSVKPDAFYDLVELASPGPYLELFARRQRIGWRSWGDEAIEDVELIG